MKKLIPFSILFVLLLFRVESDAQCTNLSAFGSAVAPVNALITITSCQFEGEYATVTGVAAASNYISSTDLIGGYFTVHQGTYNGPVIAAGTTPLAWTSTVAGTYYIHLNTNPFCGTNFICRYHYLENVCGGAAPTNVTATPSTVCSGNLSNLSATSPGNTIGWFTAPTGGSPIGTSSSGGNYGVNPTTTTTYYAAAWNGSCYGPRVAVTVNVTPTPVISSVTANPDTICIGDNSNLVAVSCGIISGFTSTYAPSNWTTTHNPITDQGYVTTSGAPNSISMTSSNSGNIGEHRVLWTVTIPCDGFVTFNWSYVTTDVDGSYFDQPEYAINGTIIGNIPGFVPGGANSQSGSAIIAVSAGQTFSLIMNALDDVLGAATTVYSNWTAPGGSSGTMNWYTQPSGGSSIGSSASGANFNVTPGSTTTYYVQTTNGGCTSPRVPIEVVVENCVLPVQWLSFSGENAGIFNLLNWETASDQEILYYNIEKSTNGIDFAEIGAVQASEEQAASHAYEFKDENIEPGNNYYRIRSMDLNGNSSLSNTVLILNTADMPEFKFFPNPTKGVVNYAFESEFDDDLKVIMTDIYGKELSRWDYTSRIGLNNVSIDLNRFANGSYFISVYHSGNEISRTFKVSLIK